MKTSLRTRLTLSFASVALILIAIISLLSSYFINQQFNVYIARQQEKSINEIIYSLGQQYNTTEKSWNVDYVHTIGMYALYDGYIIKVVDVKNNSVWDAEVWDMSTCVQIKEDITHKMLEKFPGSNGKFSDKDYSIELAGQPIGKVNVTFFGPYFYTDNDFKFLNELSSLLLFVSAVSLLVSIVIGYLISKRISKPILTAIDATGQISRGDYKIRISEKSKLTEVDDLISSVNNLADSLDKQENLKKQLTSDVAHELRTPLTTLRINMEAMIDGVLDPTLDRLQICHDEVLRITNIVKDLESLATIEDGNLTLSKTDESLPEITVQAIKNLDFQIQEKNMNVVVQGTCSNSKIDKGRFMQVIINLLTNAIKYTQSTGTIIFDFSETDYEIILRVEDNGNGISAEELPFIFERFYRADKSRNRSTGGSGIGLTIVKSIIIAHGGSIDVQSELGKGSTFTIILPKE